MKEEMLPVFYSYDRDNRQHMIKNLKNGERGKEKRIKNIDGQELRVIMIFLRIMTRRII